MMKYKPRHKIYLRRHMNETLLDYRCNLIILRHKIDIQINIDNNLFNQIRNNTFEVVNRVILNELINNINVRYLEDHITENMKISTLLSFL